MRLCLQRKKESSTSAETSEDSSSNNIIPFAETGSAFPFLTHYATLLYENFLLLRQLILERVGIRWEEAPAVACDRVGWRAVARRVGSRLLVVSRPR